MLQFDAGTIFGLGPTLTFLTAVSTAGCGSAFQASAELRGNVHAGTTSPDTSRATPDTRASAWGPQSKDPLPFAEIIVWSSAEKQPIASTSASAIPGPAPVGTRPRVLVSTDIGGTDYDDFQSMVHFLLYADQFDVEGLISSPWDAGRKAHILQVIEHYEHDYANLKSHSSGYPSPEALRQVTKQGAIESSGHAGFASATEGSEWIVSSARRKDPRPLWLLVWGGIDDLAQALHDAPDIEHKLRVYFIGGPNKKWSVNAFHYITKNHPRLWIIEANATYRGWFTGGNQTGEWSNTEFVARQIAGRGALGTYFASLRSKPNAPVEMKMGDTPSVVYLLGKEPENPSRPNWGGQFVRAWQRPYQHFKGLTTAAAAVEQFGVLELSLPLPAGAPSGLQAWMEIENQSGNHAIPGYPENDGSLRFRFSPKDAKRWTYTIRSTAPLLDKKTGELSSFRPLPNQPASRALPNWWTDDPAPEVAEGAHLGAKTVSRWREEFLKDFAARMMRCKAPRSQ